MAAEKFGAGRIQARVSDCALRDVRVSGVQVAQRIYLAVRDQVWDTVPPVLESTEYRASDTTAAFEWSARYSSGEIDYRQTTTYRASAEDDTLVCQFDGMAQRDYMYDRIGICILIDQDFAGQPFRALLAGTTVAEGTLSRTVAPQPLVDGQLHPYLGPFDVFEVTAPSGETVRYAFEGDVFELEDQRNWTDASFKIYSTPLEAGWPLDAMAGQPFGQSVVISVSKAAAATRAAARSLQGTPTLKIGCPLGTTLPRIGVRLTADDSLLERQSALLGRTHLDHVRVDFHVDADWRTALQRAAVVCERTGVAVEAAIHLDQLDPATMAAVAGVAHGLPLARLLLFRNGSPCSDGSMAGQVRRHLDGVLSSVPLFAGTDTHFADINRFRPDMTGADGVVFPVIPTVHALDDETVLDNVRAQPAVVTSSQELYPGLPVAISPVTLRPLFNAWSDDPDGRSSEAPPDPRQFGLFAAVWTLGSIKRLSAAGSDAVTYHESVTSRSSTADCDPFYQMFTWMVGWRHARLLECEVEGDAGVASGQLDGLALQHGSRVRVLLGNRRPESTSVKIDASAWIALETLDDHSLRRLDPPATGAVTLGPYGLACLDFDPIEAGR